MRHCTALRGVPRDHMNQMLCDEHSDSDNPIGPTSACGRHWWPL